MYIYISIFPTLVKLPWLYLQQLRQFGGSTSWRFRWFSNQITSGKSSFFWAMGHEFTKDIQVGGSPKTMGIR